MVYTLISTSIIVFSRAVESGRMASKRYYVVGGDRWKVIVVVSV